MAILIHGRRKAQDRQSEQDHFAETRGVHEAYYEVLTGYFEAEMENILGIEV
jgi:hypothetical protein